MKKYIGKILAVVLAASMLVGCAGDTVSEGSVADATAEATTTSAAVESVETEDTAATTTTTAASEEKLPEFTQEQTTAQDILVQTEEAPEEVQPTEEAPEATTAATTTTATEPAVTTAETTTAATTTATAEQEEAPVEVKYVALTFDDGPNTTTTAQVLDVLEKYDIIASFFLIGNNINDASAEVVKRAYDMGCEINNHSKSHPYMNQMTVDEIIEEFTYTDDKIFEITGERSKFFRPPYISVSQDMLDNIDVPFIAGIGCNDWMDNNPADRRAMSILRQVKEGDIILLHDAEGNHMTVEALDTIIPEMLAQGYKFVTVSELFELNGKEISADDFKIYTNINQQYQYN